MTTTRNADRAQQTGRGMEEETARSSHLAECTSLRVNASVYAGLRVRCINRKSVIFSALIGSYCRAKNTIHAHIHKQRYALLTMHCLLSCCSRYQMSDIKQCDLWSLFVVNTILCCTKCTSKDWNLAMKQKLSRIEYISFY